MEWMEKKIVADTGEDQDASSTTAPSRIDDYWVKVLEMRNIACNFKYQKLEKVVMASLALSHENADVKRGFLSNKRLITTDPATLKSSTINACRLVNDEIRINANGII